MYKWKKIIVYEKGHIMVESAIITAFVSILLARAVTLLNAYIPEMQRLLSGKAFLFVDLLQ